MEQPYRSPEDEAADRKKAVLMMWKAAVAFAVLALVFIWNRNLFQLNGALAVAAALAALVIQLAPAIYKAPKAKKKPAPRTTPKMTELERRLTLAKSLIEADRERKKFLAENGIDEDSDLGQQVNMVFSEYEARLKDPDE